MLPKIFILSPRPIREVVKFRVVSKGTRKRKRDGTGGVDGVPTKR